MAGARGRKSPRPMTTSMGRRRSHRSRRVRKAHVGQASPAQTARPVGPLRCRRTQRPDPGPAYAQYLIAASHYDQIPDISRDQGRTEKAIASLEEVIRKYPTSEYSVSAKAKLQGARDQLAGKEMDIGRYYMEKRDYTAAINRFKTVVTQYQTTRHVEEALARLTEAYMTIGIVGEAQTAAAVLGHNFPDSRWYKDAYNLVKSGGLEPSENTS